MLFHGLLQLLFDHVCLFFEQFHYHDHVLGTTRNLHHLNCFVEHVVVKRERKNFGLFCDLHNLKYIRQVRVYSKVHSFVFQNVHKTLLYSLKKDCNLDQSLKLQWSLH